VKALAVCPLFSALVGTVNPLPITGLWSKPEAVGFGDWYASPYAASKDGIDAEIFSYPAIYPDEETFARLQYLVKVGDTTEIYSCMWTEIKSE
jgi:hypothetical protein